jgi:hypothetical protein
VASGGDASAIIAKLISDTNKTAAKAVKDAAKDGVVVTIEWVPVLIGGQTVMVDPCRVLNR